MDFKLSEDQAMIQESARRMVERDIMPILNANDPNTSLPYDPMHKMMKILCAQGLGAPRVPADQGGTGMKMLEYGLMYEQLPAWVTIAVMGNEVTYTRIHTEANEEQRKRILPKILTGEHVAGSATTEPGSGSDPRGARTTMRYDGDDVIINGRKIWVSNGAVADVLAVACRTDEEDHRGRKKLRRVVVYRDQSPYHVREVETVGLKQGHLCEIVFEDCRVPRENVLEFEGDAAATLTVTWNGNRPLCGLTSVGLAQKAFDAARDYAGIREAFGKKIGNFQLIQKNLADIETAIVSSRLMCYMALDAIDRGDRANGTSAMAKRYACEACLNAIHLAMQCHGAMGITEELGLERLWRDARMIPIPDGTPEILALIQGRELTGFDAFRT